MDETSDHTELSLQEAAEFLNVSESFVVRLLDEGKATSRLGTGRQVLLRDLTAFKTLCDRQREAVLQALAADAQEGNMGY